MPKVVELLLPFLQPPAKVRCKVFNSRRPKDNGGFSIQAVLKRQRTLLEYMAGTKNPTEVLCQSPQGGEKLVFEDFSM